MNDSPPPSSLSAPMLVTQPVSVTRQMAAAFPRLKALADAKGLKLHHLGAGYPHPEVSDPTTYIERKRRYFRHLAAQRDPDDQERGLRLLLTELYGYGDTLGPREARVAFATLYGKDFGFTIDPDLLIPTMGATGGIDLLCSLFERSADKIAYIVDAPTYTGLLSRAVLYQKAAFYSVPMDSEGPEPDMLRSQIRQARRDGYFVAFYYTVPDGHNPGGISFSQARRVAIMDIVREEGIFVVEDAPYTYISYEDESSRPAPLVAMDSDLVIHLFTASKIGLPGPRVGLMYTTGDLEVADGRRVPAKELVLTEASGTILFHNPEALRGFEAYLHDDDYQLRDSLWPVAAAKNAVYGDSRKILLDGLESYLGEHREHFSWTKPGAGFFSVFTFEKKQVRCDQELVEKLITEHGVVTIPMFGFYPADAKKRDPDVGLDQLRLSFSFNERRGEGRREDMRAAVRAFANAVRVESRLPPID